MTKSMLVLVQTSITHFDVRQEIRRTWKQDCDMVPFCACFFVAGRSRHETDNIRLRGEAVRHKDIVQMELVDAYHNLTLKTMFSIQ